MESSTAGPRKSDEPQLDILNQRVREQLMRARAEHGEDFNVVPLSLTLLLNRINTMLVKASTLDLEELRVTATQFNVLVTLHRSDQPMSMRELAETLSIRPANLTAVVDSLLVRKLVAKTLSQNDRRSYRVSTTPVGDQLMADFLPSHWGFMEEFYAGLRPEDQRHLVSLLDQLLATLHDGDSAEVELAPRIVTAAEESD